MFFNRLQYITFVCTKKSKSTCDSLYFDIQFIAMVWNQIHNTCEVCLYFSKHLLRKHDSSLWPQCFLYTPRIHIHTRILPNSQSAFLFLQWLWKYLLYIFHVYHLVPSSGECVNIWYIYALNLLIIWWAIFQMLTQIKYS